MFVALIVALSLQSCPESFEDPIGEYSYTFKNNSSDTIYVMSYIPEVYYADYSLSSTIRNNPVGKWDMYAPQKESIFHEDKSIRVEYPFQLVYVIKKSTMDTYGWEVVRENNMVDMYLILTYPDLKEMDFTITYNGESQWEENNNTNN